MSNDLIFADSGRRRAFRRFYLYGVLAYNLPISAYHMLQARSFLSLLGCLLLLAANGAMFRYGAAIDAGRIRRRLLLVPYGLLVIGLILIGLYGFLQLESLQVRQPQ